MNALADEALENPPEFDIADLQWGPEFTLAMLDAGVSASDCFFAFALLVSVDRRGVREEELGAGSAVSYTHLRAHETSAHL
eukprot:1040789-Alexandrium_andersonii.AAC.1